MKTYSKQLLVSIFIMLCILSRFAVNGQACTPAGDQTTYGTGNVWMGYVYSGTNFNTYRGYVTAGTAGSNAFDQNFGGSNVSYATNGCPVTTELFSVRYKLTKTYTNQNIDFTVSGDDGFRLSIDGGATWIINRWNDQSYTSGTASQFMNGTYNLVLEYYESSGDNRITFSSVVGCTGAGNPALYGTNNVWQAYVYQGLNFNAYKGSKTEGSAMDANFDENFGGDNVSMAFLTCPINTEVFSARFRLTRNMPAGTYVFTIGGDDGYRFSLDGGATWVIDRWVNQSYNVTSYTTTLSGTRNMVIEYFENTGNNRISFTMSSSLLPVKLTLFDAVATAGNGVEVKWKAQTESSFSHYIVQRSLDGRKFSDIGIVKAKNNNAIENGYSFNDLPSLAGTIYYRMAMQDIDGTITFSSIANITVKSTAVKTKLFPTIVTNNKINIESATAVQKASIGFFDMTGRQIANIASNLIAGQQEIILPSTCNKGAMLVRIIGQQGLVLSQVIIVE